MASKLAIGEVNEIYRAFIIDADAGEDAKTVTCIVRDRDVGIPLEMLSKPSISSRLTRRSKAPVLGWPL